MSKVALVVTIELDPGSRDEILRPLLAHRERCLRDEPGTLQFEVLVPEDPGKLLLFELYADAAALAAHSGGPSIAKYREEVAGKSAKASHYRCTPANG